MRAAKAPPEGVGGLPTSTALWARAPQTWWGAVSHGHLTSISKPALPNPIPLISPHRTLRRLIQSKRDNKQRKRLNSRSTLLPEETIHTTLPLRVVEGGRARLCLFVVYAMDLAGFPVQVWEGEKIILLVYDKTCQTELANLSSICFCYKNIWMGLSETLIFPFSCCTPPPTLPSVLERNGKKVFLDFLEFCTSWPSDGGFWGYFIHWMCLGRGAKGSVWEDPTPWAMWPGKVGLGLPLALAFFTIL